METETDTSLPFAFMHPALEGNLIWICDLDEQGKITSVFYKLDENDRFCSYLENIDIAERIKQELINDGWIRCKPPRITFTFPKNSQN